ncbi:hypothetical protein Rsub_04786 [Raphidocelis subcapitata]|uniref:Uncharacterized protein n=1 Tax=Raphidocelis subcapitata TaxID=307507 RepID=A0A2V0P1P6_9CHLO|nr:hypothetical protein Rsub_04786 [Raphidocelis subcapitata]|eukprot:GBF91117.1 hypothetical protein Rsub_04786 [Raphidocelis subcapitata]
MLQRARDASKRCTGLVGSGGDAVGDDPPSAATVAAAREARAAARAEHARALEEAATHRLEARLAATGATHVVAGAAAGVAVAGNSSTREGEQQQQPVNTERQPASAAASNYSGLEGFTPQWVLLESNQWRKRVQVLQRFVSAARVVVYRRRAQKRLERLKGIAARIAGGAGDDGGGAEVAEAAQALLRTDACSGGGSGGGGSGSSVAGAVAVDDWPRWREDAFAASDYPSALTEAAAAAYADFEELEPEPLVAEWEYKLLGHAPEDLFGLVPYAPPLHDAPLLTGTPEDCAAPRPAAPLPEAALRAALGEGLPEAMRTLPLAAFEIGSRPLGLGVHVLPRPEWGIDADAPLQPALLPVRASALSEAPGSCAARALVGAPVLAQRWLLARGPWEVDPPPPPTAPRRAEPSELLLDREEDSDKPRPSPRIPDAAALAAYLPPAAAAGGGAAAGAGAGGEGGGERARGPMRRAAAAALPGARAAAALDTERGAAAAAGVAAVEARAAAFNSGLRRPHRAAVKL